jgi:hypothetical protein
MNKTEQKFSTIATFTADSVLGVVGTMAFGTANGVNKVITAKSGLLFSNFNVGIGAMQVIGNSDIFKRLNNPFFGSHKIRMFGR